MVDAAILSEWVVNVNVVPHCSRCRRLIGSWGPRAYLSLKVAHELAGLEGVHCLVFCLRRANEVAPVVNGIRMYRTIP